MDRRNKLLEGIDISNILNVEIGALCSPMIRRSDGRVIYVDHDDRAALVRHYENHPHVDVNAIVDVDAVWGDHTLVELINEKAGCVVASHVIEHVPNLIGWLGEVKSILKPSGELRLIIPDKRFTFDFLRVESRLEDAIYAQLVDAKRPLPHRVLEYVANVVKVDCRDAWLRDLTTVELERAHDLEHATLCAKQAMDGAYHDIHCWVFTPYSFAMLMAELCEHGMVEFECSMFHDTEAFTDEFFSGLRPCLDRERSSESWRRAASRCEPFHPRDSDASSRNSRAPNRHKAA